MATGLKIKIPIFFNEFKFNHYVEKTEDCLKTVQLIFNIIKNSYYKEEKNPDELNYDKIIFDNNLLIMVKNDIQKLNLHKKNNGYIDERVYNYMEITYNVLAYLALKEPFYRNIYNNNAEQIYHLQNLFKKRIDELTSVNKGIYNFNDMKKSLEL
jgi:hypothetical protein